MARGRPASTEGFVGSRFGGGHWRALITGGSMDSTTILIIIILLIVFGGGGWYGRGRWF